MTYACLYKVSIFLFVCANLTYSTVDKLFMLGWLATIAFEEGFTYSYSNSLKLAISQIGVSHRSSYC